MRRATPDGRFEEAAGIVRAVALEDVFPPFLTIPADAAHLVEREPEARVAA